MLLYLLHPTTSLHRLQKPIVCTILWLLISTLSLISSATPVDYVDLPIIDLANFESASAEDRALLATQVRDALLIHGFFCVIGHGYRQSEVRSYFLIVILMTTPEQTDRIFDIADIPFTGVSDEEKQVYAGTMKQTGSCEGYKVRHYWVGHRFWSALGVTHLHYSISTMESTTRSSTTTVGMIHRPNFCPTLFTNLTSQSRCHATRTSRGASPLPT